MKIWKRIRRRALPAMLAGVLALSAFLPPLDNALAAGNNAQAKTQPLSADEGPPIGFVDGTIPDGAEPVAMDGSGTETVDSQDTAGAASSSAPESAETQADSASNQQDSAAQDPTTDPATDPAGGQQSVSGGSVQDAQEEQDVSGVPESTGIPAQEAQKPQSPSEEHEPQDGSGGTATPAVALPTPENPSGGGVFPR